jgi:hypothetical protein
MQRFAHNEPKIGDERLELRATRFRIGPLLFDVLLKGLTVGKTVTEILDSARQRTDFVFPFASGDGDGQISGTKAMDRFG